MKTLKEKIEVMQAALDGKEIEHTWIHQNEWITTQTQPYPDFNWQKMDYRIKPEPLEFWINIYEGGVFSVFSSVDSAEFDADGMDISFIKTIKVKEVTDE